MQVDITSYYKFLKFLDRSRWTHCHMTLWDEARCARWPIGDAKFLWRKHRENTVRWLCILIYFGELWVYAPWRLFGKSSSEDDQQATLIAYDCIVAIKPNSHWLRNHMEPYGSVWSHPVVLVGSFLAFAVPGDMLSILYSIYSVYTCM